MFAVGLGRLPSISSGSRWNSRASSNRDGKGEVEEKLPRAAFSCET